MSRAWISRLYPQLMEMAHVVADSVRVGQTCVYLFRTLANSRKLTCKLLRFRRKSFRIHHKLSRILCELGRKLSRICRELLRIRCELSRAQPRTLTNPAMVKRGDAPAVCRSDSSSSGHLRGCAAKHPASALTRSHLYRVLCISTAYSCISSWIFRCLLAYSCILAAYL